MNDRGLSSLSEDSTGFGRAELRTCVDSLVRPRAVLEAYMVGGPEGGGHYARPLRLYLLLCGLMMLVLFLMGGAGGLLDAYPDETLAPLVEASGKSREAFVADFDGWISLLLVPLMAPFYALAIAPFLRAWDQDDLGWRKSFRAAFAFLNAITAPLVPICWLFYHHAYATWGFMAMALVVVITFMRMGSGRWYRSSLVGPFKAAVLMTSVLVMSSLSSFLVVGISLAGAMFGP